MAYNQIKRQDDEIRKLNQQISQILERELEAKCQLVELRRQMDDKDALLKELNMTHKLQEAEDAHSIAELRQRVASLEVHILELETTGQLNRDTAIYNNLLATSTDNLVLMPPSSPLDRHSSFKLLSQQQMRASSSGGVGGAGVSGSSGGMNGGGKLNGNVSGGEGAVVVMAGGGGGSSGSSSSGSGMNNSISLSSIPAATIRPQSISLLEDLNGKPFINRLAF